MALAGERLGPYTLLRPLPPLARGERWVVRADRDDPRELVLNLGATSRRDEREAERRLREAVALLARARHENLEEVLDGGYVEGRRYLVTARTDGVELGRALSWARERGAWPAPAAGAYIAHAVARGLEALHGVRVDGGEGVLGIPHRGVSPQRVLLEGAGSIKLVGALMSDEPQALAETAGRGQSAAFTYVSPEAAASGRVGPWSDVFSLGALLWELLTGQPPFRRATDLETLAALRTDELPGSPVDCPPHLVEIARRCLAKTPGARPSASELVRALSLTLEGSPDAGREGVRRLAAAALEGGLDPGANAVGARAAPTIPLGSSPVSARTAPISVEGWGAAATTGDRATAEDGVRGAHAALRAPPPRGAEPDPFYDASRDALRWGERFEVLARLGSGGMGEVYRVHDQALDEVVALKLIPRETTAELRSVERLKREVRLARRISSPFVCRIFDIVELGDGLRGLTMGYVEGKTLAELMRTGLHVDYARIARWGAELAEGLAAAHELQIVHRDLKPENVMIRPDDRVVILDFGVATSAEPAAPDVRLTQQGMIMGTPLYMSPEQLVASPLDGRSDLYALGLILAELLTGEVPMRGNAYQELLEKRVTKVEPYAVRDVDPAVPEPLASVVDLLLRPAAADRPSSAREVARRLSAGSAAAPRGDRPAEPRLAPEELQADRADPPRPSAEASAGPAGRARAPATEAHPGPSELARLDHAAPPARPAPEGEAATPSPAGARGTRLVFGAAAALLVLVAAAVFVLRPERAGGPSEPALAAAPGDAGARDAGAAALAAPAETTRDAGVPASSEVPSTAAPKGDAGVRPVGGAKHEGGGPGVGAPSLPPAEPM